MSEARRSRAPTLWLLATPASVLASAAVAPVVPASDGLAAALTFALGVLASTGPLALAAASILSVRAAALLGGVAAVPLVAFAFFGAHGVAAAALVDTAMIALAHAAGGGIGRRVQHPGHLLPACFVAAAADVASAVHPSGPTHAILGSERALAVLAVSFPVPGTYAIAPALGLGDLLFLALVFGAIAAHHLSLARAFALAMLGLAVAGAASAALRAGVPALVPVAAALCIGVPEARRVRPEDRATTSIAITVAIAVALGVVLECWLS